MNEHTDKNHSGVKGVLGTEELGVMHVINCSAFMKRNLTGTIQTREQLLLNSKLYCGNQHLLALQLRRNSFFKGNCFCIESSS